jgi:hypothetical protein
VSKEAKPRNSVEEDSKKSIPLRCTFINLSRDKASAGYTPSSWSGRRDSNPQHSAWEADALPIELRPHVVLVCREHLL